ncbi:hypothetical protein HJC23_011491, partial [Cyclotella cryptica]
RNRVGAGPHAAREEEYYVNIDESDVLSTNDDGESRQQWTLRHTCGHLHCSSCLYQWLDPCMRISEYIAAFGASSTVETISRRSWRGGGSLNFFNEMAHNPSHFDTNHRPCKPEGGGGGRTASSWSLKDEASFELESLRDGDVGDASSMPPLEVEEAETLGSPVHGPSTSFDTDPTNNVGLRQGRSASHQNEQLTLEEPTFDSPNGSFIDERDERTEKIVMPTSSQVPSRPVATSPWVTNHTTHPPGVPIVIAENMNSFHNTSTRMPTSHPLIPLLHSDVDFVLVVNPSYSLLLQIHVMTILFHPSNAHSQHGHLTSAFMRFVDTNNNLAASLHAALQSSANGQFT